MKSFYFVSAFASMAFVGGFAQAEMPTSFDLHSCLKSAQGEKNAVTRCYALDDCQRTNSDNEGDYKGCIGAAELAYKNAISGQGGIEKTSGVSTSPTASDYSRRADGKGFEDANQGKGE
jgi:hypothetical protein